MKMNETFELAYTIDLATFDGMLHQKPLADIAAYFNNLKQAGINNVMLGGLHFEEKADFDFVETCLAVRDLLDSLEMNVTSFHVWLPTLSLLADNRDEIEGKAIATLEFISALKPFSLVLHPLLAGDKAPFSDYFEAKERYGKLQVIDNVADNIRFLGRCAGERNIKVALENTGYLTPLGNLRYLPELVKKIDLYNVGYCLDTGHAHAFGEDTCAWLDIMRDKLFETHFHDNCGNGACLVNGREVIKATREIDGHLPVGFGTINWIEAIKGLKKINFSGPVTFETTGWPADNELDGLKHAVRWWRACEALALND